MWRSLVLDTPKLWSAFEIEVTGSGRSSPVGHSQTLGTIKLWLERSKNCPLSISLVYKPTDRISDSRSTSLLTALIPESHRWRRVQLVMPSKNIASLPLSFPDGLPALRSLTLHMKGLWGPTSNQNLSSLNIPWHQISYLDLQCEHRNIMTLNGFLNLLSAAQRLNSCTINLECSFDRTKIDIEKLTLPSLESLHIILQGGLVSPDHKTDTHLVEFLNTLTLPKIQTFKLGWLVHHSWSPQHCDFMLFLRNINPTLRSLSLAYLPVTEKQLLECFSQVTLLTHLDLRFSLNDPSTDPITEELLNVCTSYNSVMPALESFSLQCSGSHYSDSALLELIESRRTAKLNTFHVKTMRSFDPDLENRVRICKDDGMDIEIQSLVIR